MSNDGEAGELLRILLVDQSGCTDIAERVAVIRQSLDFGCGSATLTGLPAE